jgi:hypothetical protein
VAEAWCGDAVNPVPHVAKLAGLSPNLEVRVLDRVSHSDLMAAHVRRVRHTTASPPACPARSPS